MVLISSNLHNFPFVGIAFLPHNTSLSSSLLCFSVHTYYCKEFNKQLKSIKNEGGSKETVICPKTPCSNPLQPLKQVSLSVHVYKHSPPPVLMSRGWLCETNA